MRRRMPLLSAELAVLVAVLVAGEDGRSAETGADPAASLEEDDRDEPRRRRRGGFRRNENASPESVRASEELRSARGRRLPGEGEPAPDFALSLLETSKAPEDVEPGAGGRVRLSAYRGKKPVVLIFGSYT